MHKVENLFILKMEQQERNLVRVCVKLAPPVFCLLHTVSCRNSFGHAAFDVFAHVSLPRLYTLAKHAHKATPPRRSQQTLSERARHRQVEGQV